MTHTTGEIRTLGLNAVEAALVPDRARFSVPACRGHGLLDRDCAYLDGVCDCARGECKRYAS